MSGSSTKYKPYKTNERARKNITKLEREATNKKVYFRIDGALKLNRIGARVAVELLDVAQIQRRVDVARRQFVAFRVLHELCRLLYDLSQSILGIGRQRCSGQTEELTMQKVNSFQT